MTVTTRNSQYITCITNSHNAFVPVNHWQSAHTSTSQLATMPPRIMNGNQLNTIYNSTATNSFFTDAHVCSTVDVGEYLTHTGLDLGGGITLRLNDEGHPILEVKHDDGKVSRRKLPVEHHGAIDLSQPQRLLTGTTLKLPDDSYLQVAKDGNMVHQTFANARKEVVDLTGGNSTLYECLAFCQFSDIHIPAGAQTDAVFTLPNGVKLKLHSDDSVTIDESDGKQLYQTKPVRAEPVRGFNKFLNASDLMEQFIAYCATQRITQKDFAELPISLFIYWLIVKAAETDGDSVDDTVPLLTSAIEQQKYKPAHCKCCGRFLSTKMMSNGINFCSSDHMQQFLDKMV